jgi:sugar lactone lactonase YvrE
VSRSFDARGAFTLEAARDIEQNVKGGGMNDVELLLDSRAMIGESPTWFADAESIFWVDIKQPALHRLNPDGSSRCWELQSEIGAFALLDNAVGAVVALRNGIFRLDFATGAASLLAQAPFDPELFRFNEGICDARGRFWIGVMFDPLNASHTGRGRKATLHKFTFAHGLVAAADESELHNGFAWNGSNSEFFWSHSKAGHVYRAAYDLATGTIGRPEHFVDVAARDVVPDGAAMDEEGCYWCAIHGASAVRRYDSAGHLCAQIALPVSQPTMCAFVGPNLDKMVVTSAREKLSAEQLSREPYAGGMFQLKPGVRGLPRPCVVH